METQEKKMTKKEKRQAQLNHHYMVLERFASAIGCKAVKSGKWYSTRLWALEKRGNRIATDYCNGENGMGNEGAWEFEVDHLTKEVEKIFGVENIPGFFVNGDARGYALKIDDKMTRHGIYKDIGLHQDWGGNGILSPEITGEGGY